jgi:hypothetical protein
MRSQKRNYDTPVPQPRVFDEIFHKSPVWRDKKAGFAAKKTQNAFTQMHLSGAGR